MRGKWKGREGGEEGKKEKEISIAPHVSVSMEAYRNYKGPS